MRLRDFMTRVNHLAVHSDEQIGDKDPEVVVVSRSGRVDLDVGDLFLSELDGKICIRLRDDVIVPSRVR